MFKYIKKLTSVVVMFAVIIVFSSSKVYAGSAFSMPLYKAVEAVNIVNDINTLKKFDTSKDVMNQRLGFMSYNVGSSYKMEAKSLQKKYFCSLTLCLINRHFPTKNENIILSKILNTISPNLDWLFINTAASKIKMNMNANEITPFEVYKSFDGVTYEVDADYFSRELQLKANNGKYYEAKEENDGSFSLTTASLAKFKKDKEEANNSGNNDSGGNDGM